MDTLGHIGYIITECWNFLVRTKFTVSGITFSLANVLEVSFVVSIGAYLISIFIVGGSGDFEE